MVILYTLLALLDFDHPHGFHCRLKVSLSALAAQHGHPEHTAHTLPLTAHPARPRSGFGGVVCVCLVQVCSRVATLARAHAHTVHWHWAAAF